MLDTAGFKIPMKKGLVSTLFARPDSRTGYDSTPFKWKRIVSELSGTQCRVFQARAGAGGGGANEINAEMSLAKWAQGHNVYGINQMGRLCNKVAKEVYRAFGIPLTQRLLQHLETHNYQLGRADLTGSFNVGSQNNVVAVMGEIGGQLLALGYHIVVHEGPEGIETIYVGRSKRAAKIKFYNKYLELLEDPLPLDLPAREEILASAKKLVRFELTLRSHDLDDHELRWSNEWSVLKVRRLLLRSFSQFKFTGEVKACLDADEIEGLKPRLKTIYSLWLMGTNFRRHMAKHTYRRAREELLRFGIDIGRPPPDFGTTLSLADLLSSEKMIVTWPKHLGRLGAIYGAKK